MKTLLTASAVVVIAFFLAGSTPVASFGQCPCILHCPGCAGGVMPSVIGGHKSPDLDWNGIVNIVDFAIFATAWPPGPYMFCADYDCNGIINIVDLALFAAHYMHAGTNPVYNQPAIEHYKTYETTGPVINGPIFLKDQFGDEIITSLQLVKLATPVSKNREVVCDSIAHQTWWEFRFPEPVRIVTAQDQFGTQDWVLGDARYLVVPALKNFASGDTIPELNHYKCYEAQGPTMSIGVTLVDQFDSTTVIVLEGKYFCNPCEKELIDGTRYPVVDTTAHLTCYFVENPQSYNIQVWVKDQFIEEPIVLRENFFLCLPAMKMEVIEPGSSEHGGVKAPFE
jgi:hypothetical protein